MCAGYVRICATEATIAVMAMAIANYQDHACFNDNGSPRSCASSSLDLERMQKVETPPPANTGNRCRNGRGYVQQNGRYVQVCAEGYVQPAEGMCGKTTGYVQGAV